MRDDMDDLTRFIWRGAVGGAILPLLSCAYLIFFNPPAFFYYVLITFPWLEIPGAIVGATLWILCARFVDSLGSGS